jgi:putative membrane protein
MRLWLILGAALGLAVAAALIMSVGSAEIAGAVTHVGWGLVAIVGFHLVQIIASALAWRALLRAPGAPGLPIVVAARWIREAVNNLLFVAQIGGEFVGARFLQIAGVSLSAGGASVTVDLTMEMISQIAFTLLGLLLLIPVQNQPNIARYAMVGIALATVAILAFTTIQRSTIFQRLERGLVWVAEKLKWASLGDVAGMHQAILGLYDMPERLVVAFSCHLVSWLLGGFEVMLILHLVGVAVDLREALVIESLGQAMRALGFFIPASLGVQEGGYLLICGALGISPVSAIELSLLKRVRELVLGVPALIAWQVIEGRLLFGSRKGATLPVPAEGD